MLMHWTTGPLALKIINCITSLTHPCFNWNLLWNTYSEWIITLKDSFYWLSTMIWQLDSRGSDHKAGYGIYGCPSADLITRRGMESTDALQRIWSQGGVWNLRMPFDDTALTTSFQHRGFHSEATMKKCSPTSRDTFSVSCSDCTPYCFPVCHRLQSKLLFPSGKSTPWNDKCPQVHTFTMTVQMNRKLVNNASCDIIPVLQIFIQRTRKKKR